jgi:hypothetical protein
MTKMKRMLERGCLACIICADVTFSIALRFLGPILVLMANGLIGLVVYVYLWLLVPRVLLPELGMVPTGFIVAFGLCLLFNILFNYCALAAAGVAPPSYADAFSTRVSCCARVLRAHTSWLPRRPSAAARGPRGGDRLWRPLRRGMAHVPQMQVRQAAAHTPLLGVPPLRDEDGPPLPVGQQLRRLLQLQVLLPLPPLHGGWMLLHGAHVPGSHPQKPGSRRHHHVCLCAHALGKQPRERTPVTGRGRRGRARGWMRAPWPPWLWPRLGEAAAVGAEPRQPSTAPRGPPHALQTARRAHTASRIPP